MEARDILSRLAESGRPPDDRSVVELSVGLDKALHRFREEVAPTLFNGGCDLQLVFGPYGRGKTHFLRSLQAVAQDEGFITAYVDCKAGLSPFQSLDETYRAIAEGMSSPASDYSPSTGLQGISEVAKESVADSAPQHARELIENIAHDNLLPPPFRNLLRALLAESTGNNLGSGPVADLADLLQATPTVKVTLGDLHRKHPELPRPLGKLNRRNAASWLRALLSVASSLRYSGLVVLFDETEKTLSQVRRRAHRWVEQLANFRNFVDHIATGTVRGCAVYYAVPEDFLEIAQQDLEALSQRIERIRLGNGNQCSNPRAVWVALDELTDPPTYDPSFFQILTDRLLNLGCQAGLPQQNAEALRTQLSDEARSYAESIDVGAVRNFVKYTANRVIKEL